MTQGNDKAWPIGFRAGHRVGEYALATDLLQGVLLQVEVLILGRNPCVADVHGVFPFNGWFFP